MLVVVEGLDRTGKSTLSHQLANRHKLEYRHFDKPQRHPLDEYGRPLEAGLVEAVFDRYHWGETIWPEIFKRESEYDPAMHTWIELLLKSRGAVMVNAVRPVEEIIHACRVDDEPVQDEQVHRAATLFNTAFHHSILYKFKWMLGDDKRVDQIVTLAKLATSYADAALGITPRIVGDVEAPSVLLVGDQVGPSSRDWTLPFVPYRNTSGHFLFNELAQDLRFARNVLVVNSMHPTNDDFEPVRQLWEQVGFPPIVALGNLARQRLELQNFKDVKAVPHPQYVRRFLRKNGPGWYLDEIRKAAN